MKTNRLTLEDFKDVKPSPEDSALQIISQIAQIARDLFEKEKSMREETSKTIQSQTIQSESFLISADQFCNNPVPMLGIPRRKRKMRLREDANSTTKCYFSMVDSSLKRENWLERPQKKQNNIGCSKWKRGREDSEEEDEAREKEKSRKQYLFEKGEKMREKTNNNEYDYVVFESEWKMSVNVFENSVPSAKLDISKGERMARERSMKKRVDLPVGNNLCKEEIVRREKLLKRPVKDETPKKTEETIFIERRRGRDQQSEDEYDEEEGRAKKKPRKSKKAIDNGPEPPPKLPQRFRDRIRELNGTDVKLVIQKGLSGTDMKDNENRLAMPLLQVRSEFLTDEENLFLGTRDGKKVNGVRVPLVETCGERCELITFKRWEMRKKKGKPSYTYVFVGEWNKVRYRNKLKEGMIVQVWSFRREDGGLGFALVIVGEDGIGSGCRSSAGSSGLSNGSRIGAGPSGLSSGSGSSAGPSGECGDMAEQSSE
ncbi:B3 domain-containing protein [Actinidia chinensis var. chinensis]|uniref:B3 domain-containing protein n=1 Tax=Actinidia chinensis var. chinensis TaxID=1590841 RepID=A0A2R6QWT7_ACTCC|nr:B3 domain-containing protein [Actinidia chinensis var. chinensis]